MKKHVFRMPLMGGRPTAIVTGWLLACGAVVHRSVFDGGQRDDHWTVSDSVTGGRICAGWSMADAVRSYRRLVASYGADYPAALALAHQTHARKLAAEGGAS